MLVLVAIAGAVLGVSALSHVKSSIPDYREALVSDERPLSLNPLVGATDPPVRDIGELLYRRLLRLDGRAVPVADLASAYTVSQDGLTYHLPLRPRQEWSDGRPITVADVVQTVTWVQSVSFADAATAAEWRDVHVRPVGDGVTFDLAGPRASFPALLTQLPILPVGTLSQAALGRLARAAAVPMATSGPFDVAGATPTVLTLLPNPHAPVRPHLNQVQVDIFGSFAAAAAAFRAGQVDGLVAADPASRAQLVADGGVAHDLTTFRFVDLLFNERNPILADLAVRQAIAATIDRAALVAGPLRGMAVAQPGAIPAGIAWVASRASPAAADPAAAARTLTADGWTVGADGVRARGATRLVVHLVAADAPPLPAVAQAIAAQLAAVGIGVQVTTVPTATLGTFLVGGAGYDMALADWDNGPDPDVSSFWRSTAVPPTGFNVSGAPADPFLDQALDRLATLSDTASRVAAAAAVSSQLADDLPAVFLETPQLAFVVRPGISVVVPPVGSSAARFDDIVSWRRS